MSDSPCWQQLTFGGKENKCKPKLPIRELRARPHSLKAIAALARGLFLRLDQYNAHLAQDSLSKKR